MKAWFIHERDDNRGYVVHAESRGKAKAIGMTNPEYFGLDSTEWTELEAHRFPKLDDAPITIQSLTGAGWDMTFDGEPIESLDIECQCPICSPPK